MIVPQIALLVIVAITVWLVAVALIVVWVMGMSRNAALDEATFRRNLDRDKDDAPRPSAEKPNRTPV